MSPEGNKAIIRRVIEDIFNAGKIALITEFIAPDYTDHSALPGQPAGRDAVRDTAARFRAAFPDLRWIIREMVAEGERVALRWGAEGTHRGEFAGCAPTGRTVTFEGITLYHLRGGQVTDEWVCWDEAGLLRQIAAPDAARKDAP